MNDPCIAGFGEIMLRLSPPGALRLPQVLPGTLEATFGGGEANVCASVALLGGKSRYLTALPRNPVADALVAQLRGLGVTGRQRRLAVAGLADHLHARLRLQQRAQPRTGQRLVVDLQAGPCRT